MRYPKFAFPILLAIVLAFTTSCSKEARSERSLKRAQDYAAQKEFNRAEIEYLNALKNNPTSAEAVAGLGLLYYKQGAITRSVPFLRRARQVDPENVEIRLRHGQLLSAMGDRTGAGQEARFVLGKDPATTEGVALLVESAASAAEAVEVESFLRALPGQGSSPATLLGLGLLKLREGRTAEGEALLNQALAADPKLDIAYATLGGLAASRGDRARAEELIRKASETAAPYSLRAILGAQLLVQKGDFEGALAELGAVSKRMPGYLPPRQMTAEVKIAQRKHDEGIAIINEVLGRDPLNPEATLLRARVYQAQGKLDKATTDLERLTSSFPSHAQGLFQLATVQLSTGDVGKALGNLSKAMSADPNFLEPAVLTAEINLRQNDAASALLLLTDVIKRNPRLVRARLLLADAYRIQGRADDARATYLALERDFPKEAQLPLVRGAAELQARNPAAAREAFNRAAELSSNSPAVLDQLTALDLLEGKAADAAKRLQTLIASGRNEGELHLLLGRAQAAGGQRAEAEASLRKAIGLQPENRLGYFLLAQLYLDSRETDKALENLRIVVEKNPKDTSALLLVGILLEQKNDFEGAKSAYEKALGANPKFGPALNNLAYLYAERFNRLDEAHELASRARENTPNDAFAADTLGWILYRQGKYSWALSLIKEAAEKLPGSGEVQYHLGMTHYRLGDEAAARAAFEAALRLEPAFNGREVAESRLRLLTSETSTEAELKSLLEQTPDDPIALSRLASLHLREGRTSEAISTYQKVLKTSPESLIARRGLARAQLAAKDYAAAVETAREVRKTVKDDGEMAAVLGRAAWATGDRRYAYSMFQEAARRLPGDPAIKRELAQAAYSQGRIQEALQADAAVTSTEPAARVAALFEKGRRAATPEEARKALEEVLSTYPEFTPAMRELAVRLTPSGNDDAKAYEWASKARETDSADKELAAALGTLSLRRGDFARASTLLGEAASASKDPHLHFLLGKAQSLAKGANPKPALQRALDLGLAGAEREEAEALLKK
ncbi:MAG: tetratricopeptide repeat protein [Opitutaceae bacterium]|nr:tetratricopeptide repeat protein [Opitutaceae bacterium]